VRQQDIPALGRSVGVVGQGTWYMGEDPRRHAQEVDVLRLGFSLGMTLVDTAELYAAGGAERVVGDAIADCRDKVVVVTKIWPNHATRQGMRKALEASLRRLGTSYVDVVLLHWPTRSVPLRDTMVGLAELVREGMARAVGVSNFPTALQEEAARYLPPNVPLAVQQVPYSLADRRVEKTLLPSLRRLGGVMLAYSPLGHGRLLRHPGMEVVRRVAARHGVEPAQVALAFTVRTPGVVAIPKASSVAHVRENAAAGDLVLDDQDLRELEAAFPPPRQDLGMALPPYGPFYALAWGTLHVWARLRSLR
jgi:diketogulonate reductase-like aldo/keto reductase